MKVDWKAKTFFSFTLKIFLQSDVQNTFEIVVQ